MATGIEKINEYHKELTDKNISKEELQSNFKTVIHGEIWWQTPRLGMNKHYENSLVRLAALIACEIDRINKK